MAFYLPIFLYFCYAHMFCKQYSGFAAFCKRYNGRGHLAGLVRCVQCRLRVVSLSPTLGVETSRETTRSLKKGGHQQEVIPAVPLNRHGLGIKTSFPGHRIPTRCVSTTASPLEVPSRWRNTATSWVFIFTQEAFCDVSMLLRVD